MQVLLLNKIKQTNLQLYYCGLFHFGLFILLFILSQFDTRILLGVGIWIKPMKFAISIAIYSFTWALLLEYFPFESIKKRYTNYTVFALSFEMLCIGTQAARGEMSHFNTSGIYNFTVFSLMGLAIVAQTLFSLYIGILFFRVEPVDLSPAMLWAIRLGILIAGTFALEGGVMAALLSHTIGAKDGTPGIPFFNWSRSAGDLRIAHFCGLHALQLIPLFGLMVKPKSKLIVILFSVGYFLFVSGLFYNAILGKPI